MELIFDPQQTLHQKLYNKFIVTAEKSTAGGQKQEFFDALEVGSCVDYRNENGKWEAAVIERFSEFRTEFEISFFTVGKSSLRVALCLFYSNYASTLLP